MLQLYVTNGKIAYPIFLQKIPIWFRTLTTAYYYKKTYIELLVKYYENQS